MSTLAEQVVEQLKTDMDNVYDAGYQKGKSEGGGIDYLPYAREIKFYTLNVFGNEKVELNLESCATLMQFCHVTELENKNNTVEHLIINSGKPYSFQNAFNCGYSMRDEQLKHLTLNLDTSDVVSFQNAFNCLVALEVIDGTPIDCSSTTQTSNNIVFSNTFNYCEKLREVRFVKNTISKNISFNASKSLSGESIQSIIDGLADLTGQATQTLTLHAEVKAKLTEEQIATITSKNWTLA